MKGRTRGGKESNGGVGVSVSAGAGASEHDEAEICVTGVLLGSELRLANIRVGVVKWYRSGPRHANLKMIV